MPGPLSAGNNICPGWPAPVGGKMMSIIDHLGPSSYSQVTPGTPMTGGDTVNASEFGLKYLDAVMATDLSDDGTYSVACSPNGNKASEPSSFKIIWLTAATGAQVSGATNLSARSVRLVGIGG